MFDKYKLGVVLIILMLTILITEIINRVEEYHTNLFNGWDLYRLGDCVNQRYVPGTKTYHQTQFPNSIATKYMNKTENDKDYDILYEIVKSYKNITPQDVIIVHLRLGDVHETYGDGGRLTASKIGIDYYTSTDKYNNIIENLKKHNIKKIVLVGGCHRFFKNYKKSEIYIDKVEKIFKAKGFSVERRFGNSPDEDFIYMSNAKYFVKSGISGFSNICAEMVKKNGGTVYE